MPSNGDLGTRWSACSWQADLAVGEARPSSPLVAHARTKSRPLGHDGISSSRRKAKRSGARLCKNADNSRDDTARLGLSRTLPAVFTWDRAAVLREKVSCVQGLP